MKQQRYTNYSYGKFFYQSGTLRSFGYVIGKYSPLYTTAYGGWAAKRNR